MDSGSVRMDEGAVAVPQEQGARARLSVVLLSTGDQEELERAVLSVRDAVFALSGQLVIVREEAQGVGRDRVQRLAQQHRCAFTFADPGSGRAYLTDAGMRLATGDIVAVRDDVRVQDGDWLSAFARSVGMTRDVVRTADSAVEIEISDDRATGRPSVERAVGRFPSAPRRRADATEAVS
ncbi:MAG: hypothetical protein ACT4P7_01375 [Gemmatimonadaceae bacterium]